MKIYHISHFDLDGVMPIIFTKYLLSIQDKEWYIKNEPELIEKYIHPKNVLVTLENILSEANAKRFEDICDILIITDLYITWETQEFLASHIDMKYLIICDHHNVSYTKHDIEALWSQRECNKDNLSIKERIFISTDEIEYEANSQTLHHADNSDKMSSVVITRAASGTSLYYKYGLFQVGCLLGNELFFSTKTSASIRMRYVSDLVRLYDTYEFADSPAMPDSLNAEELNMMLKFFYKEELKKFIFAYLNDIDYNIYDITFSFLNNYNESLFNILHLSKENRENYIKAKIDRLHKSIIGFKYKVDESIKVDNLTAAIVNTENWISEISYRILKNNPEIDIVIGLSPSGSVYLRSRSIDELSALQKGIKYVDCSKYARFNGGGGHQAAAGYMTNPSLFINSTEESLDEYKEINISYPINMKIY